MHTRQGCAVTPARHGPAPRAEPIQILYPIFRQTLGSLIGLLNFSLVDPPEALLISSRFRLHVDSQV